MEELIPLDYCQQTRTEYCGVDEITLGLRLIGTATPKESEGRTCISKKYSRQHVEESKVPVCEGYVRCSKE